jgi:addiction module HigA family antidote
MLTTKRKPVTVGEMLIEEFMEPIGMTQTELAEKTGLPRKHVNELCRNRRAVTADTALILGRVFGNSPDFWLNTQRRTDLWEALNTPQRVIRIERARPLEMARLRRVKPQQVHAGLSIAASAERTR